MNILVTCDYNYLTPLKTMLYSLFTSNPDEEMVIHFIYKELGEEDIQLLNCFIEYSSQGKAKLATYKMKEHSQTLENGIVNFYYTQEMYYYLLAYDILPKEVKRVIYLDPDILIINSIREMYEMDMEGKMFAGSEHRYTPNLSFIRRLRKLKIRHIKSDKINHDR